jgi:hypothetical protein
MLDANIVIGVVYVQMKVQLDAHGFLHHWHHGYVDVDVDWFAVGLPLCT